MDAMALTGLVAGAAYGYVAHRGAFCMNSGFRMAATRRDLTKVKAYALAVAVQMVLVPAFMALGVLAEPAYPSFFPLGAVLGGLLFGASMAWAGGCAAGICYRVGSGGLASAASIAGLIVGAAALEVGPLAGVRTAVQSVGAEASGLQLAPATGMPLWAWTLPAGALLLFVLFRASPGTAGAWSWRRTGLLMGVVGIAAWLLSALAGRPFGMAVVPGSVGLLQTVTGGDAAPLAWDMLFVLGIPLGGYLSARQDGPLDLSAPILSRNLVRHFVGGLGLGAGASLAAGCTVGHGLAGVPLLAPGSIVTMAAIFAGSAWTAALQARRAQAAARAPSFAGTSRAS
jgi:hypothetical protein